MQCIILRKILISSFDLSKHNIWPEVIFLLLVILFMTVLMKLNLKMCSVGKNFIFISDVAAKAIISMLRIKNLFIITIVVLKDLRLIKIDFKKMRTKEGHSKNNTINSQLK